MRSSTCEACISQFLIVSSSIGPLFLGKQGKCKGRNEGKKEGGKVGKEREGNVMVVIVVIVVVVVVDV